MEPSLDRLSRRIAFEGRIVTLTRTQFGVLDRLLAANGHVVSVPELLIDIWGHVPARAGNVLVRAHMRGLRARLRSIGLPDTIVRSERGVGYRLEWPCRA